MTFFFLLSNFPTSAHNCIFVCFYFAPLLSLSMFLSIMCTRALTGSSETDHLGSVFPYYPTEWRAVKASHTGRGHDVIQQDYYAGHWIITLLYEGGQVMQPKWPGSTFIGGAGVVMVVEVVEGGGIFENLCNFI